jgi:hypothetical protein
MTSKFLKPLCKSFSNLFSNVLKSNSFFWFLVVILTVFLRIPSLFEGWWYGDENIYGAVGQGIVNGKMLYVDVWDNKPPLIYLIYGLNSLFFGTSLWSLRIFNLFLAVLGTVSFFQITSFFNLSRRVRQFFTLIYILLSTVYFEGTILNGENIFVPLILTGFWLIYGTLQTRIKTEKSENWFDWQLILGAIFWSCAILIKVHALVEISLLLLIFLVILVKEIGNKNKTGIETEIKQNIGINNEIKNLSKTQSNNILQKESLKWLDFFNTWKVFFGHFSHETFSKILRFFLPILTVLILPWILILLIFRNHLADLHFALLGFSSQYVVNSKIPALFNLVQVPFLSWLYFHALMCFLGIVLGVWAFWTARISRNYFVIGLWFLVVCFGVLIPGRGYPHYILQALPVFVLVYSLAANFVTQSKIWQNSFVVILATILLTSNFWQTFDGSWTYLNLQNYFGFWQTLGNGEKFKLWRTNFDYNMLTSQEVLAPLIQSKSSHEQEIFILANRPDLYILSKRLNANKFVADYHIFPQQISTITCELADKKTPLIIIDTKSPLAQDFRTSIKTKWQYQETILETEFWIWPN